MTQTEKLYYYLDKINSDPVLKEEVYENCDPKLLPPEMLEEQLSWLLEGGCKQDYSLVPFADDGSGGVYVIVNDRHVAYIDSEGGAGYIAETIDDFMNILLTFRFIEFSVDSLESFEQFMKDYEADSFEKKSSEILNKFQQEENMDMEYETVYRKLVKGLLLYPVFEIDPTDDEYCKSENLLRIDDEEFYALCRGHR